MKDPHERLAGALVAFRQAAIDSEVTESAIRFPYVEAGSLRGSELGRALWDSEPGLDLLAALFEYEEVRTLHDIGGVNPYGEIHGRVATLFSQAAAAGDPFEFMCGRASALVAELRANPQVVVAWLVRGLKPPADGVNLGRLEIRAPSREEIAALWSEASGKEFVSAPDDVEAVLLARASANRAELPYGPTVLAHGWGEILLRRLGTAIWMVTGVQPVPVAKWAWEEAALPATQVHRELSSSEVMGRHIGAVDAIDVDALVGVLTRTGDSPWLDETLGFDFETAYALRSAELLIDSAQTVADGALVALAAFALADGLLSAEQERRGDEGAVIARTANLLGQDVHARRRLRRSLKALYALRSAVAHGRRPEWADVLRFLGRDPGLVETMSEWDAMRLRGELRSACMHLLRLIFGAFLWLAVDPPGDETGAVRPKLSKGDVIERLSARGPDHQGQAEIDGIVPVWLREAALKLGARESVE